MGMHDIYAYRRQPDRPAARYCRGHGAPLNLPPQAMPFVYSRHAGPLVQKTYLLMLSIARIDVHLRGKQLQASSVSRRQAER